MFPDNMPIMFRIIGLVVPVIVVAGFIFTFALMFSPKLRAKFMGFQLKATKHMMDENGDLMKEMSSKGAEINEQGIETMARAVKRGFTTEGTIYCKHCGTSIDSDSAFCKKCGKEQ